MQTVFIIVVQIKLVVVGKDNDERQTEDSWRVASAAFKVHVWAKKLGLFRSLIKGRLFRFQRI